MNQIILSIIIPVFNGADYIESCIEKLYLVENQEFEVIIVDDGSTDLTYKKCKRLQQKYCNVIIIKTENKGVSHARNVGIMSAHGKWITFLDVDDYIEGKCLSCYKDMLNNLQNEIICFGIVVDRYDKYSKQLLMCEKREYNFFKQAHIKEIEKNIKLDFYDLFKNNIFDSAGGKFYKLDIVKNNKLLFNEKMTVREDSVFVLEYVRHVTKIKILNDFIYHYRIAGNEKLYHARRNIPIDNIKKLYETYLIDIKKFDISDEKNLQLIYKHIFVLLLNSFSRMASKKYAVSRKELIKSLKMAYKEFNDMYYNIELNTPFYKLFRYLIKNKMYNICFIMLKIRFNNEY